jgi:hypothetical protein
VRDAVESQARAGSVTRIGERLAESPLLDRVAADFRGHRSQPLGRPERG